MDLIEIREIEYILVLAEERSVSRAADRCYISQPQFSKMIRRAESRLGVELFDRRTHPLSLTPAGELLIPLMKKLGESYRDFLRNCEMFRRNKSADLTVAAPSFFCTHSLPPLVRAFAAERPDFRIRLIESNDQDLKALLASGTADLGITVQTGLTEDYAAEVLGRETIILAVPADHPVNRGLEDRALSPRLLQTDFSADPAVPAVPLALFADVDFLFLKSGNDLRDRGLELCRRAGFTPHITMELDQLMTAYYLAEAGLGATFTRASAPFYTGSEGKLCFYKIGDELTGRDVFLLTGDPKKIPPEGRDFIRFLKRGPFYSGTLPAQR